ncbi:cysteine synthase A [Peptoclostridium litorale DSM 5388]|uniref:Cysteine synthase n=1 Tax=Peptoclostridium litorale DSM 5388 TaxID=1121324 RepID=A0A069R9K9_PEPLI|nr:cysteine synthase A [Peptoclostridium litorale]KDR93749.1 cysteine synthase CysK [Peptoclostridium litorale DSM 5388]SIN85095.1 cysteine synthase A [Peptoclostridium litorale DSM 5388]
MIYENITRLIGNTPIVKLSKMAGEDSADVYVKLEGFNPGGSIKDRIALNMIEGMESEGVIKPGYTLVEPTSGNTGIGIAMVAAIKGYKVVLVMPESMSMERRKILSAYGANLVLTPADKGMKGAIEKAQELVDQNEEYVLVGQFDNKFNPDAHRKATAFEIIRDMDGKLDAFVAGVGTGGTLTGTGEVLKKEIEGVKIVAVEPDDSAVISGDAPGGHKIQGIGAGFIPKNLDVDVIDEVARVTNEQAFETARKLAKEEGIFLGISSGAAIKAALDVAKSLGKGKKVLVIAPDGGEKYLSTELY